VNDGVDRKDIGMIVSCLQTSRLLDENEKTCRLLDIYYAVRHKYLIIGTMFYPTGVRIVIQERLI
jgi:hypothetical protein